jgi:hypothetical protein
VGVSPLTIYNWEHNKSRPRAEQFAILVGLRGLGRREARRRLETLEAEASSKAGSKPGRPRKSA